MRERSAKEIRDRIESHGDMFGFNTTVLCAYLSFDEAKPLLIAEAERDAWQRDVEHADKSRAATIARMSDYMEFAWDKAKNHRGLSAIRSILKITAYLWLLRDDEAVAHLESEPGGLYGASHLRYVCERYGLAIPNDDAVERMTEGRPCVEDCDEGCRS